MRERHGTGGTLGEVYRPAIVGGRYRITEVLHRGRQSDVLAGHDMREDREVVLKRISEPTRNQTTRLRAIHNVLSGLRHRR